jgi:hypothetical protein
MTMDKLTGREAIEHARRTGATLHKYTDPTEGPREITADEADEIAREDPSLVWCERAAP